MRFANCVRGMKAADSGTSKHPEVRKEGIAGGARAKALARVLCSDEMACNSTSLQAMKRRDYTSTDSKDSCHFG